MHHPSPPLKYPCDARIWLAGRQQRLIPADTHLISNDNEDVFPNPLQDTTHANKRAVPKAAHGTSLQACL
jgi:hypothetical protein